MEILHEGWGGCWLVSFGQNAWQKLLPANPTLDWTDCWSTILGLCADDLNPQTESEWVTFSWLSISNGSEMALSSSPLVAPVEQISGQQLFVEILSVGVNNVLFLNKRASVTKKSWTATQCSRKEANYKWTPGNRLETDFPSTRFSFIAPFCSQILCDSNKIEETPSCSRAQMYDDSLQTHSDKRDKSHTDFNFPAFFSLLNSVLRDVESNNSFLLCVWTQCSASVFVRNSIIKQDMNGKN